MSQRWSAIFCATGAWGGKSIEREGLKQKLSLWLKNLSGFFSVGVNVTSVLNQSYRADIQIEVINPIEFSGQPAIEVRKDVPDKSDRVHEQDCAQIRVNIAKVTKN